MSEKFDVSRDRVQDDSIHGEPVQGERVQKALARMGFGSRREIERLIDEGKIRINGQLAKTGDHVQAGDKVNIGNRKAVIKSEVNRIRVLLYNKPEGEICTRKDEQGRRTVFDSIGKIQQGRWISVGRLDINSSGLLLFTNYGELANHLMHPSSEIEREYAVRINGEVTNETIRTLLKGVELEDGFMKFDKIIDSGGQGANHWYHVIIKEGKNREVRRLWQSQDVRVSRLIRVRYGSLVLPRDLKAGKKVELSLEEVKALFEDAGLEWPRSDEAPPHKRTGSYKKSGPYKKRARGKGGSYGVKTGSAGSRSEKSSRDKTSVKNSGRRSGGKGMGKGIGDSGTSRGKAKPLSSKPAARKMIDRDKTVKKR